MAWEKKRVTVQVKTIAAKGITGYFNFIENRGVVTYL